MIASIIMILVIMLIPASLCWLLREFSFKNYWACFYLLCYRIFIKYPFKECGADITLAADLSSVLVLIGMPLILFSANLPALKKLAKPMIISFNINIIAVLIVAIVSFFIFNEILPNAHNISGMLVGTYTGGTPNMIAIGHGLNAGPERIMLLQTADMIGGGIYFFMLLSIMPRVMKKVLPDYKPVGGYNLDEAKYYAETFSGEKQSVKPFKAFMSRVSLVSVSIICVLISTGICLLLPSRYGNTGLAKLGEYTALIMLLVTSFGIILSFVKKIRNAPGSYSSGQYFLLMFSVGMGLCFDLSAVSSSLVLLGMLLIIQFGTVLLHIIMARIWKIDYQTMIITSTAGVFGPAFIIPVANALHNDEIILPGILCGILGYAIGNYLGIGVGQLLYLLG